MNDLRARQESCDDLEFLRQEVARLKAELKAKETRPEQNLPQWQDAAFLKAAYNQSSRLAGILDIQGAILFANQIACDMAGCHLDELVGKPFWEAPWWTHSLVEQNKLRNAITRAAQGERVQFETTHRAANGKIHHLLFSIKPVINDNGDILGLIPEASDISDRIKAENALRESEYYLRALTDNLPSGMVYQLVITSQDERRFLYVSAGVQRLHEISQEEVYADAKTLYQQVHPDDKARLIQTENTAHKTGSLFEMEFRFKLPSGKIRWALVRSSPRRKPDGSTLWAGVEIDITEQKLFEQAVQEEKAVTEAFFSSLPNIAYVLDINGKFIRWNRQYQILMGWSDEEMSRLNALDTIVPGDRKRTLQAIRDVFQKGESSIQIHVLAKDGREIPSYCTGVRFEIKGVPYLVGVGVDLSSQIAAEEEKVHLQQQLLQAMKMEALGRLAGGVAHDFNNLLTTILGNIDLTMMDMDQVNPSLEFLQQARQASESATVLTRQLLAFSRKQVIEPRLINLNEMIANLNKILMRLIGENISLKTIQKGDIGVVRVDPGQFEQVLMNLAVNAKDAMPDGGSLVIETSNTYLDETRCTGQTNVNPGWYVMMSVSDTGHGMTDEVKQHLFEPFFTTKAQGCGTGLGLATIFGIIKQAGGHIQVYSEPKMGTTFKIYLPLVAGEAEKLNQPKAESDLPKGSERILLVEDEKHVREFAVSVLRRLGYDVLECANGAEAIKASENCSPHIHLLMTDIVMPGINGHELAERLSHTHPNIKVLYTSGYAENVISHHGVLPPNLNFIGKPYSMQILATTIRDIIDAREPISSETSA